MPIHDWSQVEAGIYHHFHHSWIEEIQRSLNAGILPRDYYALAEQHAAGYGPDVLTLEMARPDDTIDAGGSSNGGGTLVLAPPRLELTAETDMEFYRRKQKVIAVRHVTGDRLVAIVEIVSPGNKSGRKALRAFVEKAADLLDHGIHLLILDLHPPGRNDPQGIHAAIWEELTGQAYLPPANKPLTLAAYETDLTVRAYVQPAAVGDVLTEMPLFLEPRGQVGVPLEPTYERAWQALPRRWQAVIEQTVDRRAQA